MTPSKMIRLPVDVHLALKQQAAEHGRTMVAELRQVLDIPNPDPGTPDPRHMLCLDHHNWAELRANGSCPMCEPA